MEQTKKPQAQESWTRRTSTSTICGALVECAVKGCLSSSGWVGNFWYNIYRISTFFFQRDSKSSELSVSSFHVWLKMSSKNHLSTTNWQMSSIFEAFDSPSRVFFFVVSRSYNCSLVYFIFSVPQETGLTECPGPDDEASEWSSGMYSSCWFSLGRLNS